MTFNKNLLSATLLTVAGLTAVSSANAATTSDTFNVNMTIEALCIVSTGADINLSPTTTNTAADPQKTTFSVACSKGTPYDVTMSTASGTDGTGKLIGLGSTVDDVRELEYTLSETSGGAAWNATYKNAILGEGFEVAATPYDVFATLLVDSRNAKPDTYTDEVSVIVSY